MVSLEETTLPSTISSVTITTLRVVEVVELGTELEELTVELLTPELRPELEDFWTDFEELAPRL